ncbi:hypothetical protein ACJX0J_015078, partial [Zea mays]
LPVTGQLEKVDDTNKCSKLIVAAILGNDYYKHEHAHYYLVIITRKEQGTAVIWTASFGAKGEGTSAILLEVYA